MHFASAEAGSLLIGNIQRIEILRRAQSVLGQAGRGAFSGVWLADDAVLLREGRIAAAGLADTVLAAPLIAKPMASRWRSA